MRTRTKPFPQANMRLVSINSRKQRSQMYPFLPAIGLTTIDYGRMGEVDAFYILAQNQRDYYRDSYDKLRKIDYFKMGGKKFATQPDPTTAYFSQPKRYTQSRQPILYPLTDEYLKPKRIPEPIVLRGLYNEGACFRYKK